MGTARAKSPPRKPPARRPANRRIAPRLRARAEAIFDRLAEATPAPRTELAYQSPYTLLVAVALSAQATDVSVNKATDRLYRVADTPAKMVALGAVGLTDYIKSIGLYRTKAKNVVALSQILLDRYGGEVPLDRVALEALPGVGRKTASVILNELGALPAIAVDTHVFRVSHRLQLSQAPTPEGVERDLMVLTPPQYQTRAHHWLILHGRYTCMARRPKCAACVVADLCPSRSLFVGA